MNEPIDRKKRKRGKLLTLEQLLSIEECFREPLSYRQISEKLGIPIPTIKNFTARYGSKDKFDAKAEWDRRSRNESNRQKLLKEKLSKKKEHGIKSHHNWFKQMEEKIQILNMQIEIFLDILK